MKTLFVATIGFTWNRFYRLSLCFVWIWIRVRLSQLHVPFFLCLVCLPIDYFRTQTLHWFRCELPLVFFRRAAVILRFTVCPMCAEFLVDQSGNKRKQPTNKKSYLWCDSSEFSSFTLRFNWIFLSRFFVLLPHAFRDWMQLNWFRCFFVWPIGINRALFAVRCCSYSLETLQLEFSIATDSPKNKNDLSYENINNYIQRDYNF